MTVLQAVNGCMCRGKALHLLITAFEKEREWGESGGKRGNERKVKAKQLIDVK